LISLRLSIQPVACVKAPGKRLLDAWAFIRQAAGGVVTAAGKSAYLLPSVPYTGKLISKSMATGGAYANLDPGIREYRREASPTRRAILRSMAWRRTAVT
jgi:hypothetical protein